MDSFHVDQTKNESGIELLKTSHETISKSYVYLHIRQKRNTTQFWLGINFFQYWWPLLKTNENMNYF